MFGTAFFVPWFLGPAAFGTYTLLTSLFIYANKNDLGLSQLADRKLAVEQGAHPHCASAILRARMIIGAIMLGMIVPLAMGITYITDTLPAADTGLAIAAGGAFMMANGPVTVFRATSKIWEFTASALLLQAGLTAPRLAGLAVGGVTGCFAALALWYGAAGGSPVESPRRQPQGQLRFYLCCASRCHSSLSMPAGKSTCPRIAGSRQACPPPTISGNLRSAPTLHLQELECSPRSRKSATRGFSHKSGRMDRVPAPI